MAAIRILVVEDHAVVRHGFRTVLGLEDDFRVIAEAATGADAIRLAEEHRPDVTLLDMRLPDTDGVAVTRAIAGHGWSRVLVVTTFDVEDYVLAALRAGAAGYVLKDVEVDELSAIIRRIAGGDTFIQPSVAQKYLSWLAAAPPAPLDPLTPREQDVLRLLAEGYSNRQIGEALHITEHTVKNHVAAVLGKLQVTNRTSAALQARAVLKLPPRGPTGDREP